MKVFGITGWKNTGKTTLTERLVAAITAQGFTVSTVKHAHHRFDVDQPGKDSHRHRMAGASEVLLASSGRWVLMHELRGAAEPPLAELLPKLAPVDLVLVEGYKSGTHRKIEARRGAMSQPLLAASDGNIRALATQEPVPGTILPVFDLDDIAAISAFILAETGLK